MTRLEVRDFKKVPWLKKNLLRHLGWWPSLRVSQLWDAPMLNRRTRRMEG
jgi:hypothetical protein